MPSIPNAGGCSTLKLYSGVPWDKNGENQVLVPDGGGISTQIEKYRTHVIYDFSFIRNDNRGIPIRVPGQANEYLRCNYLSIDNAEFPIPGLSGVIYGFITNVQYYNDNTTFIYWEEDPWQTWMNFVDFGTCLVERAHVPPEQDTIQSCALLPEPVNIPNYEYDGVHVIHYKYKWHLYASEIPAVNKNLPGDWTVWGPGGGDNAYSACWRLDANDLRTVQQVIENFTKEGMLEAVVAVFASADIPEGETITQTIPSTTTPLHGIVIKNKKCLTSPYTAIVVSGPGISREYKLELFGASTTEAKFHVKTIIQPNGQFILWPDSYAGASGDEIIAENVTAFSGFRQAAYSADTFRNSMVQHLPTMAISAVAAALTGGASFLMNIAGQGAQTWQDWLVSHSAFGNANASNLIFADDVQFSIGIKSVSREALRTIDRYFTMYGYNVQAMHKPLYYYENRGDRKCVYIKTKDVEIHGQIPKYALEYISGLFNNGVRIWTNEANIGDYD